MKTAISIPDPIFLRAEKTAKKFGMTRSKFYVTAAENLIESLEKSSVTDQLNRIYRSSPADTSALLLQRVALRKDDGNREW